MSLLKGWGGKGVIFGIGVQKVGIEGLRKNRAYLYDCLKGSSHKAMPGLWELHDVEPFWRRLKGWQHWRLGGGVKGQEVERVTSVIYSVNLTLLVN